MEKLPILKFTPLLKQTLWGGEAIVPFKRLHSPLHQVGESWELSAVPGSETVVASGTYAGKTLGELIDEFKADFLGAENYARFGREFPLLIKFIDARKDLSIQVHPNDEMARRHGEPYGKNELWYIIRTQPEARLMVGLKEPLTPQAYAARVADDSICNALCEYRVQPGDCFYLPAGRIHSIGAGCFLAEIQQSSDVTYRIYDFKRKDANGNLRELHTELAAEAIDYTVLPDYQTHYTLPKDEAAPLVNTHCFSTAVYNLNEPMRLDYSELDSFVVLMATAGGCTLTDDGGAATTLQAGETVLVPACIGSLTVVPGADGVNFLETYC